MERKALRSKWADYRWEAVAVVPDSDEAAGEPRRLWQDGERLQCLHPGLELRLYGDEADNYLLNVGAPEPRVFVMWRYSGATPQPQIVTVSYGEAARMMDSGEQVDGVPMPDDLRGWIEDFARCHYRPPEPKRERFATSKPGRKTG